MNSFVVNYIFINIILAEKIGLNYCSIIIAYVSVIYIRWRKVKRLNHKANVWDIFSNIDSITFDLGNRFFKMDYKIKWGQEKQKYQTNNTDACSRQYCTIIKFRGVFYFPWIREYYLSANLNVHEVRKGLT